MINVIKMININILCYFIIIAMVIILTVLFSKKSLKTKFLNNNNHNHNFSSFNDISIKKDSKDSKAEIICREFLEKHFNKSFAKIRPAWLKNPITKRCLELDCYNDELKIAIEYNGIQHYIWPNFTNQSYQDFVGQQFRDSFKFIKCKELGIELIIVPYTVKHNDIPNFLGNIIKNIKS